MTHTTDAERAEFERELIDNHHYLPSDFSFKDGFYGGDDDYIQFGWDLWQAARRAPAVPETIEQRAKKLKGLQVLIGATAGVPEAIELARSRFIEAYGRSPLHDDLAYACLLIDAYGGAPAVPAPQGVLEAAQRAHDWMDSQADSQSKGNFHSFDLLCLRQERDALAEALAAAPQPPEADMGIPISAATPVQMPEPVACVTPPWGVAWNTSVVQAGTKLYTEQQVRQLLAQHARAPLTENQWKKLWEEWFDGPWDAEDLIRSIERAHGITGDAA